MILPRNLELLATIFPDPEILSFQDFEMPEHVKPVGEKDKLIGELNDAERLLFVISVIAKKMGQKKHDDLKSQCGNICKKSGQCPFPEGIKESLNWLDIYGAFTLLMWKKISIRLDFPNANLEIRSGFQIVAHSMPVSRQTLEEMGFKCEVSCDLTTPFGG
jgi:hypothetical protein